MKHRDLQEELTNLQSQLLMAKESYERGESGLALLRHLHSVLTRLRRVEIDLLLSRADALLRKPKLSTADKEELPRLLVALFRSI